MRRRFTIALGLFALVGTLGAEAGLWRDVFRGLDLSATPTGSPVVTTGDGTRVNGARSGRLRIVPNGVLGKGYRLEYNRSFGADSQGRPETLHFGIFSDLTLQGAVQATAGYDQFQKKVFSGDANFTVNSLQYDLKTKFGVQDAELTGTLNATGTLSLNPLG
jgi:hypothetical protein